MMEPRSAPVEVLYLSRSGPIIGADTILMSDPAEFNKLN